MSIASLVIAVAYLLLLLIGALGALLVLLWLFEETQAGARPRCKTAKSLRNMKFGEENTYSTRAEIELSEDRAA